jgi:hypothetical protein
MSPFDSDPSPSTACFAVTAQADPGVLPRIVELFAKRGLTPTHLRADWRAGGILGVEVQMAGMDPELAVYIGQCVRAIVAVDDVQVSEAQVSEARCANVA